MNPALDPSMNPHSGMKRKGMNYDVGTYTRGRNQSSREVFLPGIVNREMEIIKNDLHCNAVRISGQDLDRLTVAAECALRNGLEVWFSPSMVDAGEHETRRYLAECAQAAEKLRQNAPDRFVFVAGCELTFFMKGLVLGATPFERMATFMKPWKLLASVMVKGSFHRRLNRFLAKAVAAIREHYQGQLTYASGTWEQVDWRLFDFVGVDYYRDEFNAGRYREQLKAYFKHGKPVVILEFGSCTYQGAGQKGGYGWNIVDRTQTPPRLNGSYVRDEGEQVRYLTELLDIFSEEQVEGAFWFTFVMPFYPSSEIPGQDLDIASYGVVRALPDQTGTAYPDMPWEPKQVFHAMARLYKN